MRIVTEPFLLKQKEAFPLAASWLDCFRTTAKRARWQNLVELRRSYPHADLAVVSSGRKVTIFNVAGTKYRLITAIHFDRQILYALQFLTHAEYSKNRWKNML